MALTTTCRFVVSPDRADKQYIILESRQNPSIAPDYWEMYVKITDPLGNVIVTPPSFSGPGNYSVTGTTLAYYSACLIPVASPTTYLNGVYRIEIWKRLVNDSIPAPVKICDENYNFTADNTRPAGGTANSKITYVINLNCSTNVLTASDTTDYSGQGLVKTSAAMFITPPPIDGRPFVGNWPSISITPHFNQVPYEVTQNVGYDYNIVVASLDSDTRIKSNGGAAYLVQYPITCDSVIANIIQFVTDPNSSDKGKITFTTSHGSGYPYPGVGYEIYVKITDPTGTVVNVVPPFSGPGNYSFVYPGPVEYSAIDIPLDSNGKYLSGNYIVELWKKTIGASAGTETKILTGTYNFCPHNTPQNTANTHLSFSETLSCVTGEITVTDNSKYSQAPDYLVRTYRDLRIAPPLIDGRDPVFTSSATLSLIVEWTNVDYGISEKVSYEYNTITSYANNTFKSVAGVINFINYAVTCDSSICATLQCLATYFTDLEAKACGNGGWSRLTAAEQGNFTYAAAMVNLASMSLSCGNVTNYQLYLNKAKSVLSDCGCGCSDCADDPKPFVPTT